MMWSGLGVNYKALQANWTTDIPYFNSLGLNNVRVDLTTLPTTWVIGDPTVAGSYAYWRLCAKTFAAAGFYVTHGPSGITGMGGYGGGGLTATLWSQYRTSVLAEATYLQAQGIALGDFTIGNELEEYVDGTTLTAAQCRANIRQLATDVKAVYSLSPISYGCDNYNSAANNNFSSWASEGLGGLDYLSIHMYGQLPSTQNYTYVTLGDFTGAALSGATSLISNFGSKIYISEFGVCNTYAPFALSNAEQQVTSARNIWSVIRNNLSVPKAFVYSWVGYLNGDNQFAMQNTDGSFNPMWDVLLGNDRRTFQP